MTGRLYVMMVQWTLNILLSNYEASLKERQRRVHYQSQQCPSCGQFTIAWEPAFDLAPVVQKLDRTTCVSTGYIAIQRISNTKTNCVMHWIVIYPVDSAIHLLNNWSLGDIVRYHARAAREMRHDIASSSLARTFLLDMERATWQLSEDITGLIGKKMNKQRRQWNLARKQKRYNPYGSCKATV